MILQGKGLIVPDVHEKIVKLKRIVEVYDRLVDWILFLGDWLDSFQNDGQPTPYTYATCQWLANNISNPKYRFLWGNHDIHYAFPFGPLKCSGWNSSKQDIVVNYLKPEHWKHFRLLTWIVGSQGPKEWLCSHAGMHEFLLHPVLGYDKNFLVEKEQRTLDALQSQQVGSWLQAGQARGGGQKVGGVDWLDWDKEFSPIEGLNQIVGHTVGKVPRVKETSGSFNLCLDTNLNHIILVDDSRIDVQEFI